MGEKRLPKSFTQRAERNASTERTEKESVSTYVRTSLVDLLSQLVHSNVRGSAHEDLNIHTDTDTDTHTVKIGEGEKEERGKYEKKERGNGMS